MSTVVDVRVPVDFVAGMEREYEFAFDDAYPEISQGSDILVDPGTVTVGPNLTPSGAQVRSDGKRVVVRLTGGTVEEIVDFNCERALTQNGQRLTLLGSVKVQAP